MIDLPPVAILAGGVGSRLGTLTDDTPKPLIEVGGKPFLLHQIELLATYGATRVVLCVGYLGDRIEATIGTEHTGVEVGYSYDDEEFFGTLGAIKKARAKLGSRFLVLYGDTYLRINYRDVADRWRSSGQPACMTVLRNHGQWDTSNARLHGDSVVEYDKQSASNTFEWIDYGLTGLTDQALQFALPEENDLAPLFSRLAASGALFGYEAIDRFYEIGTPDALAEAEEFFGRL